MNYIATELPNYWNSQTSEVQSALYETARERNLSNNRSVNPPIKIFGNTVEKQKKQLISPCKCFLLFYSKIWELMG